MSKSKKRNPYVSRCSIQVGEVKRWRTDKNKNLRRKSVDEDIPSGNYYKKLNDNWCRPDDGRYNAEDEYKDRPWKAFGK